jgi:hypothetical protein
VIHPNMVQARLHRGEWASSIMTRARPRPGEPSTCGQPCSAPVGWAGRAPAGARARDNGRGEGVVNGARTPTNGRSRLGLGLQAELLRLVCCAREEKRRR